MIQFITQLPTIQVQYISTARGVTPPKTRHESNKKQRIENARVLAIIFRISRIQHSRYEMLSGGTFINLKNTSALTLVN